MEELEKLVRELDVAVTGKHPTGSPCPFNKEDWVIWTELFYCSDGGYSRLFFHLERGHVYLDSVSTIRAHSRWDDPNVKTIRSKIDMLARELVREVEDPEWEFTD